MKKMTTLARLYVCATIALGALAALPAAFQWKFLDPVRFCCYLLVALFASGLKVRLPAVKGTMSVSYVFILLGIVELSFIEIMLLGLLSTAVQIFWRPKSPPQPVQVCFNLASMMLSVAVALKVYHALSPSFLADYLLLRLALTASVYFVVNTISVAIVIGLSERRSVLHIWRECYVWSFAYYLMGASVAAGMVKVNHAVGWQVTLLALPILYVVFRSYRLYLGRLEDEKQHAVQMAKLHLRTIEALALAIEAKDETTHKHLHRVQSYAIEIGKTLNLSHDELEALRAASVLHDIGKLAVPEHIISKPGKLTVDEFEKMKIHPTVGAQILETVQFPYPVVPIVHAHHEKWDGSGYPRGLSGTDIPIGARILAAVDCLDALASDRQYRRALPMNEAMAYVVSESGKSFDPEVVTILQQRYHDLEKSIRDVAPKRVKLDTGMKIERGLSPAAGFEQSSGSTTSSHAASNQMEFLPSIAAARQEAQVLFELSQELGSSLSLNETLSVLDLRLRKLITYDAMVVYLRQEDHLVPEYANGDNLSLFSALRIPLGEGLSGWVAETQKAIINGNPSVEFGYLNDPTKFTVLRSALAIPLCGLEGNSGVVALYHKEADFFQRDHLRILTAIASKIALVVQNALRFRQVEMSASTDGLTGLPNASSLFLQLDSELSRSRRNNTPLTILVCDLDGFKQVNDRFGHLEGNRILRMVAAGLREQCREYDYVARMGGDEFVIILPGEKPSTVQNKIAAIRRVVEEIGFQVTGERILSISSGEAGFPEQGKNAEDLLAEADSQMYQAKKRSKAAVAAAKVPDSDKDLSQLAYALEA